MMHLIQLATAAFAAIVASRPTELSPNAQSLFDYSMALNDARFDPTYKYIIYEDNGPWSVRFTAWYVPGLLYRDKGDDVENAKAAITNILACQMTDNFTSPWYGTWKLSPDEPTPTPSSALYPPEIYSTYDPNWREFVSVQLIQIVEEFSHLIGPELVHKILLALEIQAVGSMRRNGTVDGDNLVPAYTNPALMRALAVGWIGARTNNQTLIDFANSQAHEIYELFTSGSNVFAEYNAPTYAGTDIAALAASLKHGPADQFLTQKAAFMLSKLWENIGLHYNGFLGNLAGPYDRANSRDLTQDSAILSLWLWGILGESEAPRPNLRQANWEYDAAEGASMALLMSVATQHISPAVLQLFTDPPEGDRIINDTVRADYSDTGTRFATSWVSKNLMAGGIEQYESTVRGQQFVPAIVHWASDTSHKPFPYNGFFSLYPIASTIKATATANKLVISYPNATQAGSESFQFMINGIPPAWNLAGNVVSGFSHLPCLEVNASAPGLELQPTVYGSSIYTHKYYNVTYVVPAGFSGIPTVSFDLEYTC